MDIHAKENQAIVIGRVGENERIRVIFDVDDLIGELGTDISFTLLHQKPGGDTAYPVPTAAFDGDELIWTVTAADTSAQGRGRCELICTVGDVVAKTVIWSTVIQTALDGSGDVPDVWESWQKVFAGLKEGAEAAKDAAGAAAEAADLASDAAQTAANDAMNYSSSAYHDKEAAGTSATEAATYAENAAAMAGDAEESSKRAQDAREGAEAAVSQVTNLQASAETLEPGSAATAQYDAETGVLTLGIPTGATGPQGPQGDPGEDYVLTAEDKAEIAGMVNVPVTDVQVNGSSVVAEGVASIEMPVSRSWELIADVTVEEDSATFIIDTDIEGQGFALSQMLVRVWLEPATTGQNDNVGTTSLGVNVAGADVNVNSILVRYVGGGAATYMELKYELVCGVSLANTSAAALPQSTAYLSKATSAADNIAYYRGFRLKQQSASTSLIPSGSIVKIYGIRI